MMLLLLAAASVAAVFYAGGIFHDTPQASIVIATLAVGFLGIIYGVLYRMATEEDFEG